jgi:hypothetical protein
MVCLIAIPPIVAPDDAGSIPAVPARSWSWLDMTAGSHYSRLAQMSIPRHSEFAGDRIASVDNVLQRNARDAGLPVLPEAI